MELPSNANPRVNRRARALFPLTQVPLASGCTNTTKASRSKQPLATLSYDLPTKRDYDRDQILLSNTFFVPPPPNPKFYLHFLFHSPKKNIHQKTYFKKIIVKIFSTINLVTYFCIRISDISYNFEFE